nr:restriction endonuclease subunit S [Pseudomonas toyotomiensis]
MSFPRYPEYKDSRVESLGVVPKHWQVKPLKFVASVQTGIAKGKDNAGKNTIEVPYLRVANVQDGYLALNDVSRIEIPEELLGRYSLQAGDVLMNEGGDFDKLGRGHIWNGEIEPCIHQNHVFAVRPSTVSSNWLNTITGSGYAQFYFMTRAKQSTNLASISSTNIMELPVVVPPEDEQRTILQFLSTETTKIDNLMAEQEKLIALLKEKRQAVIAHAVTKGLDPTAPMKGSGVEWIGEIPNHWKVARIKDVARLESGHTPSKTVPEYWEDCDIPWVSLNDSKQLATTDYITETAHQINELGLRNSSARMLPADSVVFTRDATIGLAAIITRPMAVSQHLVAWCPTGLMNSVYLLRVFNAMKEHLDSFTFGATIKTIGMADIKRLATPVPPISEQIEVAAFIGKESAQFDALINDAQHAIDLLKERRTALISAAVTGQIDVRGLVKDEQEQAA